MKKYEVYIRISSCKTHAEAVEFIELNCEDEHTKIEVVEEGEDNGN